MTDPRIVALPAWLRLHGPTNPDTDPAEAEWCSMLLAAANEIERLRGALNEIAERWPRDNADTVTQVAEVTLWIAPPPDAS